ncbi:hypothetical protein ACFY0G_17360 [Streptomyces sp. NPDC001552]|uniref:hypothetical protein n=1 Tax=Streptomyces sp. NPDC001552 TaxID=3364587 RepID=UPI00369C4295
MTDTPTAAPLDLPRLFHGGFAGLKVGDLITPSPPRHIDGCVICAARARGETYIAPGLGGIDPPTGRPDRVYLTSDREYGLFHASLAWYGDLYVVAPEGTVERSEEDYFETWCAPAARILSVYTRAVQLTMPQRHRLFRRWGQLEAAAARAARLAARAEKAALAEDGLR